MLRVQRFLFRQARRVIHRFCLNFTCIRRLCSGDRPLNTRWPVQACLVVYLLHGQNPWDDLPPHRLLHEVLRRELRGDCGRFDRFHQLQDCSVVTELPTLLR